MDACTGYTDVYAGLVSIIVRGEREREAEGEEKKYEANADMNKERGKR